MRRICRALEKPRDCGFEIKKIYLVENPVGPVMRFCLLAVFLLACAALAFPLQVFVSNASIGEMVYVLAQEENGSLFEGTGAVVSPSGRSSELEIRNGQAAFGASEVGEWEVRAGGMKRKASVFDEAARAGRAGKETDFSPIFFAAIGIVFVLGICGLFVAAKKALNEKGREEEGQMKGKRRLERG